MRRPLVAGNWKMHGSRAENAELIKFLVNVTDILPVDDEDRLPPTAMQPIDGHVVYAPLASLIDDVEAELVRLAKRKAKTAQDLARSEAKLANRSFVDHAPAEIVEKERARIAEFQREIAQLEEQTRRVAALQR